MRLSDSFSQHALFTILIAFIFAMSLMGRNSLNSVYHFSAHLFAINTKWVSGKNAIIISNTGHVLACFTLTLVGFRTFRNNILKAVFFASGTACLLELCQTLSATRQAKLEDILFSLSGVFLAFLLILCTQHFTHSPQSDY